MAIYTKTGDKGTTSLFDGTRVKKSSLRVDVYGTFDECCAQISVAQKLAKRESVVSALEWIQNKLFQLNAELATEKKENKLATKSHLISKEDIQLLEQWIDEGTEKLPKIHEFILPGKCLSSAQLHVARTVCRRGERLLSKLADMAEIREEIAKFINRLSDCLYIFAREEDYVEETEDVVQKILRKYQEKNAAPVEKTVDFFLIQAIIQACVEGAKEMKVPVSIAIADQTGVLKAFYRMDDALLVSEELAAKKAYSAIAMQMDTHELSELVQPNQPLYQLETLTDGQIVTFGGGFVLKNAQGKVVGALGVSGGSVEQDMLIANRGIEKYKERS